jgi:hypothetical protein
MNQNGAKSDGNGKILTASIAESACHPAETAVSDTAPQPVKPLLTGNENGQVGDGDVTPTNTNRHTCHFCGRGMTVKRPSKRYCNDGCRRNAWLKRNPEKAAALAISDKQRLRAHLESRGVAWVEVRRATT